MIEEIEIENFRCFEHTKISGFERVNLIGGKNNSGKTALLEAILLNQCPQIKSVLLLRELRQESEEFSKAVPERTWENFFFNQNKQKKGSIITCKDKHHNLQAIMIVVSNDRGFISDRSNKMKQVNDLSNLSEIFSGIDSFSDLLIVPHLIVPHLSDLRDEDLLIIKSDSRGIRAKEIKNQELISKFKKVQFIAASIRNSSRILAEKYDKADLNNKSFHVLPVLKILDPSIETMKTFSIGEPKIYLKRQGENYLPISFFGDAINRVTEILLNLINGESNILLIDEIENGIHYTSQRDFWRAIFELAFEVDVQIFATTHSLEMIQAFVDTGLNYKEAGAYFELARSPRTNQIIGIKRELETLDYALKYGKGVRGE